MPSRVHVLTFGVSLCQEPPGLPYQWPVGHRWVRAADFAGTPLGDQCPRCRSKMTVKAEALIRAASQGRERIEKGRRGT